MLIAGIMLVVTVDPLAAARAALDAQVAAWNRGDLEAALTAYCDDPALTWVNRSGVSRGFAGFATGMRGDFADRTRMGRYAIEPLDARAVGPDAALIVVRWSIVRDGTRLMGGVSTQLWRSCAGRYRVVLEHAS